MHNAFATERLKHNFNIVIQLDVGIERFSDPEFGCLGDFFSNVGFQGADATYAEALNS